MNTTQGWSPPDSPKGSRRNLEKLGMAEILLKARAAYLPNDCVG